MREGRIFRTVEMCQHGQHLLVHFALFPRLPLEKECQRKLAERRSVFREKRWQFSGRKPWSFGRLDRLRLFSESLFKGSEVIDALNLLFRLRRNRDAVLGENRRNRHAHLLRRFRAVKGFQPHDLLLADRGCKQ